MHIVWPVGTTSELPASMAMLCVIAHFSALSPFLLVHSIFSTTKHDCHGTNAKILILIWHMTTNATTRAPDPFHRRAGRCVASGDFNFAKGPFILNSGVRCKVCVVAFATRHRRQHNHQPHIPFLGRSSCLPLCFKTLSWGLLDWNVLELCSQRRNAWPRVNAWGRANALWRHSTPNSDAI